MALNQWAETAANLSERRMQTDRSTSAPDQGGNMHRPTHTSQQREISRRQILRTSVWAAPALMVATAIPAAAASPVGDAPIEALTSSAFTLEDPTGGQHTGQLRWEGGQVSYNFSATGPDVAQVPWVATVLYPNETDARSLGSGTLTVTRYQIAATGPILFGTPPMPAGTYTVTFTIFAVGGASKSATASYELSR
jgi:hypothetical protein